MGSDPLDMQVIEQPMGEIPGGKTGLFEVDERVLIPLLDGVIDRYGPGTVVPILS